MSLDVYHEESQSNAKLYNRDVLKLLIGYIFTYKKYLFIAVFFVFIITGANLSVPYILKTLIDRFIFKNGKIVYMNELVEAGLSQGHMKHFRHTLRLSGEQHFLFRSRLKYFSRKELQEFVDTGILSRESYVFIESPTVDQALEEKIRAFVVRGEILDFKNKTYLFSTKVLEKFRLEEIYKLRSWDFIHIIRYVFLIISILIVQFVSSYLQILFLMKLSQYAMRDLRKDLFRHILTLEVSYYDGNPIGKLVNRVTNDIETLNELFSSVLITLFQDLLLMFGIALVMFFTDLYLALIVAAIYPFVVTATILFRVHVRNAYRVIRTKITELNSFLNETITGIRIIQIFVRELENFKKFTRRNTQVYRAQLKQLYVYAVFRPIISFLRWLSIASVIYFGALGIVQDRVSFGLLIMFIAYIERFFAPVRDLSEKFDIMQSATAAGEKIISILNTDAVREETAPSVIDISETRKGEPDADSTKKGRRFEGKIEFRDVWFAYKPEEWVLRGVSFSIDPKDTLAIVGETGAGKTTIISLLSKFYRIQRGSIFIDGKNIDDIPLWLIRRNIVSVMQDVFLFSKTIRDNVTLGTPYEEAWFRSVCGATHINRFLDKLPEGELEKVMERGATFSAGERQLLSFARALYFDPSVLILDEATSNIDTETEKLIQDATQRLTEGRTSIVIAHRLSTIKMAKKIIVLEKGRIVEEGTHQSLLAKKSLYHKLYTLQFSDLV
jgi:ABC-type multidrug transport system fused ATPase/permease subunit